MIHSESLLRQAESHQPASHPRASTIEVDGSGPVPEVTAGLAVKPLDFHVVNTGSIPTGPTHSELGLQPHPGDVLKSTTNVRKSLRSGLNLEGRLSDPQISRN